MMSISSTMFTMQVLLLLLTNAAMIPAVVMAYRIGHGIAMMVMVMLLTSSMASAVYHLCDLDLWCVGGVSFTSLQVYDVLFSSLSMSVLIGSLSPWHDDVVSAFTMMMMSVLIVPITYDATAPINVLISLGTAFLFMVFSWIFVIVMHRYGESKHVDWMMSWMYPLNEADTQTVKEADTENGQKNCEAEDDVEVGHDDALDAHHHDEDDADDVATASRTMKISKQSTAMTRTMMMPHCHRMALASASASASASRRCHHDVYESVPTSSSSLCSSSQLQLISLSDDHHHDDDNDHDHDDDQDAAPSSSSSSSSPREQRNQRGVHMPVSSIMMLMDMHTSIIMRMGIGSVVIAMALAMLGFVCFILQSRTTYYLYHSAWHVLMMTSAFILVRYRLHIMMTIRRLCHEK